MAPAGISLTLPTPIQEANMSTSLGEAATCKSFQACGKGSAGMVGQLWPPTLTGEKAGFPAARELSIAHKGLSAGLVVAPRRAPMLELPNTEFGSLRLNPPSPAPWTVPSGTWLI